MPNFLFIEDFLADHEALFAVLLNETTWDERMKARKTASYGVAYNYSQITYENKPFPHFFGSLLENVQQNVGFKPNNCLLNYYPDGSSSMGFHSDTATGRTKETGVAIVSLGASRDMNFKHKTDSRQLSSRTLNAGSLIYLDDATQEEWLHSIQKSEGTGARISLSFRSIEVEE